MKPQEIVIRVVVEQPSAAAAPGDGFTEVGAKKPLTPSQKLRLALRTKYGQTFQGEMPESWYEEQINRIISAINKK